MRPVLISSKTPQDFPKSSVTGRGNLHSSYTSTANALSRASRLSWGRNHRSSSLNALGCAAIMLFCPVLVTFYAITLSHFHGSLFSAFREMVTFGPVEWFSANVPRLNMNVSLGYLAWVLFQAAIYQYLPVGNLSLGQLTPAGNILEYRTNGLGAWIISHCGFLALSYFGYTDPAILARNWQSLLLSLNVYGFLLSAFAYWKAHAMPSHEGDRKFGGMQSFDRSKDDC